MVKSSEFNNNNLFGSINVIFEDISNEVDTSLLEKETNSIAESLG